MTGTATWTLLEATSDEASVFASLDSVLALPWTPAAPRNRRRHVRLLHVGERRYYLKVFERAQLKNRVWLRCSSPRARDEASREVAMSHALQRAGVAAPRAVAVGRRGALSCVLLAALDGASVHDLWRQRPDRRLLLGAARFAGSVLAHGFRLPDLAADHVFATARAPDRFAVLDLHNASLGHPDRRTLRRVLRHGASSLRELGVDRRSALRVAIAVLRPCVARPRRRALLERLPVWDTHSRYGATGKSESYRTRNPERSGRELKLLDAVWPGRPGESVLDSPCGAGRLWPWLTGREHAVIGCDRSPAMLATAGASRPRACADALALPLGDRATDGVVMFRFLHHLPEPSAHRAILEAARVADRWLVVSTFHPLALHGIARSLRGALSGAPRTRFSLAPSKLVTWLRAAGFEPVARARDGALRELCVFSFRRVDAARR